MSAWHSGHGGGEGGGAADLLVLLYPPQKHNNPIAAPEGFIPSLVHARMLLLPPGEGVGQEAVGRHGGLPLVAPSQHDAADVQLPCHTCLHRVGRLCFMAVGG